MANTQVIKRRIKSAQNISQITRAMQMVAASKMKRATAAAQSSKPYADKIAEMTRVFAAYLDSAQHPLLKSGSDAPAAVVLISTNKGLTGGLNSALFRRVSQWFPADTKDVFITLGRKGKSFVIRTGRELVADFSDTPNFTETTPALTKLLTDGFLSGEYGSVWVVYNSFISALKHQPARQHVLPIAELSDQPTDTEVQITPADWVVEPSIQAVLQALLQNYLENQIYARILQAEASEHSARMMAMKNATDNAMELTEVLTLEYNKIRQQSITEEISDMVTARSAVV